MEETEAAEEQAAATPIFAIYRRGYDPEQVDRYVLDQQRRLDESTHRASESERKLAAAVGQLRELHRRVAVYESEARSAQPPQLDTLGERVQRILQEAWEGAYNLRQEAEKDVSEMRESAQRDVDALRDQVNGEVLQLREVASKEAADVVDEATRRALHIRDETERRRQAYLERVERDREQAISQITYLYDQRQGAIAELARLQAAVQTTIEEMVRSPLGRPAPGVMDAVVDSAAARKAPGRPSGGGIESPQLPGMDDATPPDIGEDEPAEEMERFVRPGDLDTVRAGRPTAAGEADQMERVMHVTDPPSGAVRRTVMPETSGLGLGRPEVSPPSVLDVRSTGRQASAGARPEPASAGEPGSEMRRADRDIETRQMSGGSGSLRGSVIPRPRDDGFGPVEPRGVVAGRPSDVRSPGTGVAHSVQAGIEAAKGRLRRPRPQGVYDAEQDGWSE
jgi:hypothetical protein